VGGYSTYVVIAILRQKGDPLPGQLARLAFELLFRTEYIADEVAVCK
jgi:hypothetical protein